MVISPRISPRFGTKLLLVCGEGRMSGITARIGENRVDFMVLLAACMVEREEMRKKKPRREREGLGAVVTKKEEKEERGLQNYKTPLPLLFL